MLRYGYSMNEGYLSAGDEQVSSSSISIPLSSVTIVKSESGYRFIRNSDGGYRNLTGCKDLWDAIDNILKHVRLTPSILNDLHSLRQKSAELRWDEQAIADYYVELVKARKAEREGFEKASAEPKP